MTLVDLQHRVTPDELLALPDSGGIELIDGQAVEKSVSRESSRIGAMIVAFLLWTLGKTGKYEVYGSDLGYQCFADDPGRIRKPDASVISLARLEQVARKVGFMPIPADLAVEVLSPNDLAYEVSAKVEEYLSNGFRQVWVVDPSVKTVAIYSPNAQGRVLREADEIDGGEVLPGFRCHVSELFGTGAT